jgi:hypothetical protein
MNGRTITRHDVQGTLAACNASQRNRQKPRQAQAEQLTARHTWPTDHGSSERQRDKAVTSPREACKAGGRASVVPLGQAGPSTSTASQARRPAGPPRRQWAVVSDSRELPVVWLGGFLAGRPAGVSGASRETREPMGSRTHKLQATSRHHPPRRECGAGQASNSKARQGREAKDMAPPRRPPCACGLSGVTSLSHASALSWSCSYTAGSFALPYRGGNARVFARDGRAFSAGY